VNLVVVSNVCTGDITMVNPVEANIVGTMAVIYGVGIVPADEVKVTPVDTEAIKSLLELLI
jgi:hypothetical protein